MDFVNFEEAKQRLGKTDDELQEMIKQGEIRAFRDEGTWKFRQQDIAAMAGDAPDAGPESGPTEQSLEPSEGEAAQPVGEAQAPAGGEEEAAPALAGADEELPISDEGLDEDAGDTLMSIDADILFAEEEEVPADSAAETWIAADSEGVFPGEGEPGEEGMPGVEDAMTAPEAEPAPLALSPETDESSLQEVLSDDELAPGGEEDVFAEEPVIAVDSESGLASVMSTSSASTTGVAPSRTRVVTLVEPPSHHGAFTVLMGLAVACLIITTMVLVALTTDNPALFIKGLGEANIGLIAIGLGIVLSIVIAIAGWIMESQRARREAAGA